MALIRAAVTENSADLWIVFDIDVDRSGVVDNKRIPNNGDKLIDPMSAIVLKEHPVTTIVTDARTSMARPMEHQNIKMMLSLVFYQLQYNIILGF